LKRAEFLAPKRCVIGQRKHDTIAKRFSFGCFNDRAPLVVVRDPGQFLETWDEAALSRAAKAPRCRVPAATYWIAYAAPLLDQIVVEQPDCGKPLL
jgi:hypothetical protein